MRQRRNGTGGTFLSLVAVMILLLVSTCGDDSEVAEERDVVPAVTPSALAALPEGVEVASIVIQDGEFQTSEIILQEDEPSVLSVDNQDDRAYRLQIGDLVTPTEIRANAVTEVKFTTPIPEEYEAELLAEEEDDVIATIPVVVISPGETNP